MIVPTTKTLPLTKQRQYLIINIKTLTGIQNPFEHQTRSFLQISVINFTKTSIFPIINNIMGVCNVINISLNKFEEHLFTYLHFTIVLFEISSGLYASS